MELARRRPSLRFADPLARLDLLALRRAPLRDRMPRYLYRRRNSVVRELRKNKPTPPDLL